MPKIQVLIVLAASIALAAPKERAWQQGMLLDLRDNVFFAPNEVPSHGDAAPTATSPGDQYAVSHNGAITNSIVYDRYVIQSRDSAYLVEFGRLRNYPAARVTARKPIQFAVEKNKLWLMDEAGKEYETKVLKQVAREGSSPMVTQAPLAPVTPVAPQVASKVEAKAEVVAVKEAPKPPLVVAQVVVAKVEVKQEPVPVKPPPPQDAVVVSKDRPWQSGHLLSTGANRFFENVAYTTESDASNWSFVQASDGKFSASTRGTNLPGGSFTYDNYVIESEFCVYLVQRGRAKTAPLLRFPGTKPLKFAVEKSKLWMIDEDGKESETKIVKQIQKASPADTLTRTASR